MSASRRQRHRELRRSIRAGSGPSPASRSPYSARSGFALATLLAIAGLVARADVRESVPGYLFAGSTIALAAVLYLGYASFVILGLVCVLCVTTYAAVIGLFLTSGAGTSFPMTSLPRRAVRDLKVLVSSPVAIALALLFAGAAVSTLAFFPRAAATDSVAAAAVEEASAQAPRTPDVTATQRSEFERYYTAQPRLPLVVPAEGAKVLVVKFNDYQCPPCRATYMEQGIFAKSSVAAWRGAPRAQIFRSSPSATRASRPTCALGMRAAVAVRLAGNMGGPSSSSNGSSTTSRGSRLNWSGGRARCRTGHRLRRATESCWKP